MYVYSLVILNILIFSIFILVKVLVILLCVFVIFSSFCLDIFRFSLLYKVKLHWNEKHWQLAEIVYI